jgi:hypothetical protein
MEVVKADRKVVAGCVKGKAYTETELLINLNRHSAPLSKYKGIG